MYEETNKETKQNKGDNIYMVTITKRLTRTIY